MAKKRTFSGIQPSGTLHIGNYFGALKQWVAHQEQYDCVYALVDYHALTTLKNPQQLREFTREATLDLLGVGIDPVRSILFKQSDVPQHTELAWIFECLVTVPFLMQAHAYKDKVAKGLEANAGLFNYPMLMAADILLYDTDVVPVGADQRQHVEYAREAATKFNKAFGDTFKEPKEVIMESVGAVPGTDGQKMSKSYGNTIPLFGTKDEIAKAVMKIVTNTTPEEEIQNLAATGIQSGSFLLPINLFRIHNLLKSKDELFYLYQKNLNNYKAIKEALIEDLEAFVAPMRGRRDTYAKNPDEVKRILAEGSEKARTIAEAKMKDVRKKVGVTL